jgi:hypothetical protein
VFFGTATETQTAPLITSTNSATFAVGSPGSFTVTASGYPAPALTEAGALPNGVTFNTTTNLLSGTPAAGTTGSYPITFTATNSAGTNTQNFTLTVQAAGTGPTASFVGTDTTTQGAWQSKYGADGYSIANSTYQSLPSYATFTPQGYSVYTWTADTTDPRALAIPGGSGGVASCWTDGETFDFNLNITDGNTHQIALYALDWDSGERAETVTIVDANNPGNVLSTQSISKFTAGTYLVWTVSGHVQINVTVTGGVNAVISGVFFGTATETQTAPLITSTNSATFAVGSPGSFTVTASGYPAPALTEAGALPTGVTLNTTTNVLSGTPASGTNGSYPITITATNVAGTNTQNFTLTVQAAGTGPTASFVGTDTTTQGAWQGKYGADGYSIANTTYQSLPSYATFTPQGYSLDTWNPSTTDPRALAIPGGSGGVASCWTGSTFDFNVNITDGNTHQIALYALDWDSNQRAETVSIVDANNPSNVLSTQTISKFNGGTYLVWTISGHVQINVTLTGGVNAVASGVFFAP